MRRDAPQHGCYQRENRRELSENAMKKRAKKFVPKYPGERSLTEAEIVAAAESDPTRCPKSALTGGSALPAGRRRLDVWLTRAFGKSNYKQLHVDKARTSA